jgi:hypothetical protein
MMQRISLADVADHALSLIVAGGFCMGSSFGYKPIRVRSGSVVNGCPRTA